MGRAHGAIRADVYATLAPSVLDMVPKWCHNGVMDLGPYVDNIQRQLAITADASGEEARMLAERLTAPLDAAVRLTLQDVLAAAADEITCELAPGSVELRLRAQGPEFVVTVPRDRAAGAADEEGSDDVPGIWQVAPGLLDGDEGAMARVNLRLPDQLKARVEQAAGSEGMSVNALAGARRRRRAGARRFGPPA